MDALPRENILTRRANQRHYSIIAQSVKSPMALHIGLSARWQANNPASWKLHRFATANHRLRVAVPRACHPRAWGEIDVNTVPDLNKTWHGAGVKSVKNGFARAVEVAKLDLSDGNVTPHTLRHTAATWLMQLGTDPWEAAGYLGMSVKVLIDTYGHHHPDYMKEASGAITRKRKTTKRVVGTTQTTKPAVRSRSIRAI
jgi:hypothetical protein